MSEADHIPDRQQRILQRVAAGEGWREAAKKEGCSDSYSRVVGARMKRNPLIAKQLDEIREKGCEMAAYGLAEAMKEAEEVIEFAKQHKHPTAYFFAVRHRAHLSGLLIDRVEIATVDLTGALAKAEARVVNPPPPTIPAHQSPYYDAPQRIDWQPRIPGQQVAKPASDGESDTPVKKAGPAN